MLSIQFIQVDIKIYRYIGISLNQYSDVKVTFDKKMNFLETKRME